MIIEIRIPTPGESITEVEIASWLVEDGDMVEKDQEIAEIESDKATLPLIAEEKGKIKILIQEGETAKVGSVACEIDVSVEVDEDKDKKTGKSQKKAETESEVKTEEKMADETAIKEKVTTDASKAKSGPVEEKKETSSEKKDISKVKITPLAKKMMEESQLSLDDILHGLKKITTKEVEAVQQVTGDSGDEFMTPKQEITRDEQRVKMSQLRKKLSQRLVAVKNETAMLTTFNEVNMQSIIVLRKKYQKHFQEKHGIKLGFMSFFTRAVVECLKLFPKLNSYIDNDDVVTPAYYDIGIAVQTDKGLMVPVLRNAETLSIPQIEMRISELAAKARNFRISMEEMSGGTFSITNGGIFGSLMSTPILNPPQSGILGMHNIVERPIAVNGKVEIAPMMYVALSYDHRIVDGRESVSFLVKLKEMLESPHQLVFGGKDPEKILLGL